MTVGSGVGPKPTRAKIPNRCSRDCRPRTRFSPIMSTSTTVERARAETKPSAWKMLRR